MTGYKGVVLLVCQMLAVQAHTGIAAASLRPSFDVQVPVAPGAVAVAGAVRLVYELHLTSFAAEAITVTRMTVMDADRGVAVADFAGEALGARLGRPGLASGGDRRVIEPGMRAIVYVELTAARGSVPRLLKHRIEYVVEGSPAVVTSAPVPVSSETPPLLGPPLRGGPWVAVYEPAWERGHRRVFYTVDGRACLPGRWAIDWMKVDAEGRFAHGDADIAGNWYGYGAEVLAVADGVVAAARDDVAEVTLVSANPKHAMEDAPGNYIALDLGQSRFALYEHLIPGSLRVKPGDRVRRGQVIAALGFTGDSTGPHLHFHVADGRLPLSAEGLPYVIASFKVAGAYESVGKLGSEPWTPVGGEVRRRDDEFPASGAVVVFHDTEETKIEEAEQLERGFVARNVTGTFVLLDPERNLLHIYNVRRAKKRFIPYSTFKIVNSLIGLETGAVSSVDQVLPYGGRPQPFPQWEHDMPLREAIRLSAVPIYQELARRIGLARMARYVRTLGFGNGEIGAVVDRFWLDGPLMISAVEQVDFLTRMLRGDLPLRASAVDAVREITLQERTPGSELHYKTGWGFDVTPQLGWIVGWITRGGRSYPFAMNMDMTGEKDASQRVPLAKECLASLGLLP